MEGWLLALDESAEAAIDGSKQATLFGYRLAQSSERALPLTG